MATSVDTPGRDADRTRAAILFAAQQIFAEKGFVEAGVRDITALAGVNQSLVSRYFGGKLKLFEAALADLLDARLMTDLSRKDFGRRIVAIFTDPRRDRAQPLSVLLGATADSEARAIALRLLRDRVLAPLSGWLGGAEADARAARFMIVSTGFFTYRDLLPLAEFSGPVEPRLRQWLEDAFQAIVDD